MHPFFICIWYKNRYLYCKHSIIKKIILQLFKHITENHKMIKN